MQDQQPILVTARSACAMRDEGIRYAYNRVGMIVFSLLATAVPLGANYLIEDSPDNATLVVLVALGAILALLGGALFCGSSRLSGEGRLDLQKEIG